MYLVVAIIASCPRRGGAGNVQTSGMHEFLNLTNYVLDTFGTIKWIKEYKSISVRGRQVGDYFSVQSGG